MSSENSKMAKNLLGTGNGILVSSDHRALSRSTSSCFTEKSNTDTDIFYRYNQLQHMARLVEKYPTLLKKTADPGKISRKNFKHIAGRLRENARRLMNHHSLECLKPNWQDFRHDVFPILPLDSCLTLFVKTLEHYPLEEEAPNAVNLPKIAEAPSGQQTGDPAQGLESHLLSMKLSCPPKTKKQHVYPPEILTAINLAINDMAYVHTSRRPVGSDYENGPKIHRTKYTPFSAVPANKTSRRNGIFVTPWYPHIKRVHGEKKTEKGSRRSTRMVQPYDERELRWLEAFLVACDFMGRMDVD